MAYGLIGLYGLYLIMVGYKGNSSQLLAELQSDAKGFFPWVLALGVLAIMYRSDTLKPVVKPFIALAILTFALKNWNTLANQVNTIYGSQLIKGA